MVLISDANKNRRGTEKKEQTRGFSRGPLLVQRWRRGSSPTFHPAPAGTQTPPFFSFVFDSSKLKNLEFVKKKKKSLEVERAEEATQILPKIAQIKLDDTQTCAALQ